MTEAMPSPSEEILARLLSELEQTPEAARKALIDRYLRDFPAYVDAIRDLVEVNDRVRPASSEDARSKRLPPGHRLGPFRVVRFVDHGGMGEVYEAKQELLDRRVALKVIRDGFVNPIARARFVREQLALARLHHTVIVPVYHAGEEGDVQYCAMQYIEGVPLSRVVAELSRLGSTSLGSPRTPIRDVIGSLMRPAAEASNSDPFGPLVPDTVSPPTSRLTLSPAYFVSVAEVMAHVADAVQHGHDRDICHRDIKPSNLLIDASETCFVIDYGLAGVVNGRPGGTPPTEAGLDDRLTHGPLGTPRYMAPEQFAADSAIRSDPRSDVWGLGVTLYEMLTLRPAFQGKNWTAIRDAVLNTDPAEPRSLVRNVPRDLAAICFKAIEKNPDRRYGTAREFARELRRWSRGEPTEVRPGWKTLRPLRLLVRRNKAWAAAIFALLLLLAGSTVWAIQRAEQRKRELEYSRTFAESEEIRYDRPYIGWSGASRAKLKVALRIRPDADLRSQALATFTGPEARQVRSYELPSTGKKIGLKNVAFGPNGQILAGGYPDTPTLLFNGPLAQEPAATPYCGLRSVAFIDGGIPVELTPAEERLVLRRVDSDRALAVIPLPKGAASPVVALSPDARLAAVTVTKSHDEDGRATGFSQLWSLDPNTPGAEPTKLAEWGQPSSALAFASDGKYLATGSFEGAVRIYSTADGGEVLSLEGGQLPILSLAFGRNFWKSARDKPRLVPGGLSGRLLAVGTRSGTTYVWDLETRGLANQLCGSSHYVNAVAFGPDGSSLITAGHQAPIRWDVASGQAEFSLSLERNDRRSSFWTGAAVSPDGKQVALTKSNQLGGTAGLEVIEFVEDRGIRTFRGLVGQVQFVRLSPKAKWVGALSQTWQVGVWERETGRIAYVWDVPVGATSDNADLAFDEKEETVYFVSGRRACRLNLATGERAGSWSIPFGLSDRLAICPGQNPMLLRLVWKGPQAEYRWRELLEEGKSQERSLPAPGGVKMNSDGVDARGKYVVVPLKDTADQSGIRVYDIDTGNPIPLPPNMPFARVSGGLISEGGKFLAIQGSDASGSLTCIYRLPEMTLQCTERASNITGIDDTGTLVARSVTDGSRSEFGLFRIGEKRPILSFDIGRMPGGDPHRSLTGDGRFCIWGRSDGTVCVADIDRCLEELAEFPER